MQTTGWKTFAALSTGLALGLLGTAHAHDGHDHGASHGETTEAQVGRLS